MKTWLAACGFVAPLVVMLPAVAISPAEVSKIAKSVTVAITTDRARGSGAIVDRSGNTYTVLTAAHVVKKDGRQYTIELSDGQKYPVKSKQLAPAGNLDLAIVKFQSDRPLPTIKIGDSNSATEGSSAYVAGYPLATAAITQSVYTFSDGKITANSSKPFENGYSVIYNCYTLPGMSGGPVLNERGELIAIHGRGDVQESARATENANVWVKTGFNLGIPVNSFTQLANKMGINIGGKTPTPIVAAAPRTTTADDYFVAAATKFRQGDYPGAIGDFDRAIAAKPQYTAAYLARAEANIYLENGAAAVRDANMALKLSPQSSDAYTMRAGGKAGEGDFDGAIADIERALALNPRNARAYLYRGVVEIQIEPRQALTTVERAIAIDPSLGDAYSIRAAAKYLTGNAAGSEADFAKAIQLNANSFLAYVYRGLIRVVANKKAAGFADLDRAIAISPKNPIGYNLRGQAYVLTENYSQAIDQFSRAIALQPTNGEYVARRGVAYLQLQKPQSALADFDKALKISPQNEIAYQGRALYYLGQKDFQRALDSANRALRINDNAPDSYTVQGVAYIGLQNRAGAKTALQKAAALYKKLGNIKDHQQVVALLKLLG